jgi:hypothetical protein
MTKVYWTPELGDIVWMNYPDSDHPEGEVVGFVPEGERRAGQPIIQRLCDEPPAVFSKGYKKGDKVIIHPIFLLPFRFGGPEYKRAEAEGLVG